MDDNQLSDFVIDPRDLTKPSERTSSSNDQIPQSEESKEDALPTEPINLEREEDAKVEQDGFDIDSEPELPVAEEQSEALPEESTVESAPTADVTALVERIAALEHTIAELTDKLEKRTAIAQQSSDLFDKMYNELQSYKNDLYGKLLKPFVLSTLSLLEDTNRFIERLGEDDAEKAAKYLRTLPDDLVDILESNGVILYEDESDTFNPRTQRTVKQVPTADLSLNNKIAKRVRPGYNWNGSNLRPETVWIYKYDANAQAPQPEETPSAQ